MLHVLHEPAGVTQLPDTLPQPPDSAPHGVLVPLSHTALDASPCAAHYLATLRV